MTDPAAPRQQQQRRRRPSGRRTRVNPLLTGVERVDWKDVDFLREFIGDRGKIVSRRISRVNARTQRRLRTAIKRARQMALLPYE